MLQAAKRIAASFSSNQSTFEIRLLASFQLSQLEPFLKSYSLDFSCRLSVTFIPFNTLDIFLNTDHADPSRDVLILTPWDFLPITNWRIQPNQFSMDSKFLERQISDFSELVSAHNFKHIFYLDAPISPIVPSDHQLASLQLKILSAACQLEAIHLSGDYFCLDSYFYSGCPIANTSLSPVSQTIAYKLFTESARIKLIVLDLDNTLWNGVLGEDGVYGINASQDPIGYLHYAFQGYLKRLKSAGVLLAIASKNDIQDVREAFRINNFPLEYDDFVCIKAGYNDKSVYIEETVKDLNIGLSEVIFIDDNDLEIENVAQVLPSVRCFHFLNDSNSLCRLLKLIHTMSSTQFISQEDAQRTAYYQKQISHISTRSAKPADLSSYLKSLSMKLVIRDKTQHPCDRAIQLINKTNQFNLNGKRLTQHEFETLITAGSRIYTAELFDVTGVHGEILALIVNQEGFVQYLVMSCRVMGRKVEYAFLSWILGNINPLLTFDYVRTTRNEPLTQFLSTILLPCGSDSSTETQPSTFQSLMLQAGSIHEFDTLFSVESVQ